MAATTMQLEFAQAMTDFKTMFPDMDKEVIEAVLRANQGAVDATIDQLLAMSTDNQVKPTLQYEILYTNLELNSEWKTAQRTGWSSRTIVQPKSPANPDRWHRRRSDLAAQLIASGRIASARTDNRSVTENQETTHLGRR